MSAFRDFDLGLARLAADKTKIRGLGSTVLWTPSQIATHLAQTDLDMNHTRKDVVRAYTERAPPIKKELKDSFLEFIGVWKKFHADANTWMGGNVERSEEFRRRLSGWRGLFGQHGVKFSTPEPVIHTSADYESITRKVMIGVAIAGGAYLAVEIIKAWRSPGRVAAA
jgi:hypothetical protein